MGEEPARYLLADQLPYAPANQAIVVRLARRGELPSTMDAARRAVERIAPDVAVQRTITMERIVTDALGPARQIMSLLTMLSALALTLGAIGVYGIVSHFVTRQKRDWGIRMALGLRPARVIGQIVKRGGALVLTGSVAGILAFLFLARLFTTFLYGVGAADPLAMAAAAATLLTVGLAAALIPALRASRIDPAVVLREQ
jgi:putative ABC transport system permease protein